MLSFEKGGGGAYRGSLVALGDDVMTISQKMLGAMGLPAMSEDGKDERGCALLEDA